MRHVAPTFFDSTFRRGASLEQFLGAFPHESERLIRWIEIRPEDEHLEVWEFIAQDLGDEESLDVYGFLGGGDDEHIGTFETSAEALSCAAERGAKLDRWVNQFVIQDEYRDFIRAGRPANWPGIGV